MVSQSKWQAHRQQLHLGQETGAQQQYNISAAAMDPTMTENRVPEEFSSSHFSILFPKMGSSKGGSSLEVGMDNIWTPEY